MIVRNDRADARSTLLQAFAWDGHWKVFNHHVYEYRKGLRNLVVQTLPREYAKRIMSRLDDLHVAYVVYPVGKTHINVFLGAPECLEIVRLIGKFDLSRYTPQEDFMLGVMLGYDRRQQCLRYLARVRHVFEYSGEPADDTPGLPQRTVSGPKGLGFTLIELLVVISVIAVLLAILMPGLRASREQGQRAVCGSQLRQLGIAHVMYQESHDGWITPAAQDNGVAQYWYNTLGPYFEHTRTQHGDDHADDIGRRILLCPRDQMAYPKMLNPHGDNPAGWLSYAINSQPTRHVSSRTRRYAGLGGNKIVRFRCPAGAMLHCDFAYRAWVCDSVTLTRNQYASEPGAHYEEMPGYPEQNKTVRGAYRHGGRMNVLWADGHVSLLDGQLASAEEQPAFWGAVYDSLSYPQQRFRKE